MMRTLFWVVLCGICMGCMADSKQSVSSHDSQYFDLASFLNKQTVALTIRRPKVRRILSSNGIEQEVEQVVDWKKELSVFMEADINKPILRDVYLVQKDAIGTTYVAIDKNLKVQQLSVEGNLQAPTAIKILWADGNLLYQTNKELYLQITNQQIKKYRISGSQKIIFADKLVYQMEGEVL